MRVLLITQGMSRVVVPIVQSKHQVVGVVESMPRGSGAIRKKGAIYNLLRYVYSWLRRRPKGLGDFCQDNKIPYIFFHKENEKKVTQWVSDLNPDVMVVFSMSRLLKKSIFSIPKMGAINLHPAFLPDYRGPNPDFWQYYNMELNPGVTVHYIDEGEDTGDILYQERMPIPLGIKSPDRLDRLVGKLGVSLILKALDSLEHGSAPRLKQSSISTTVRARNLDPGEHASIIDWEHWPIERIWHVLRGTELWLNALPLPSGVMSGQRWVIEDYEEFQDQQNRPGSIYRRKRRLCVATRGGCIYLKVNFKISRFVLHALGKV